jgi:hypothetical protein
MTLKISVLIRPNVPPDHPARYGIDILQSQLSRARW